MHMVAHVIQGLEKLLTIPSEICWKKEIIPFIWKTQLQVNQMQEKVYITRSKDIMQ